MVLPGSNDSDGNNKSALSESELDFLISLKELAIRRAKNAGYKDLGDKFDLRMLRALGFILLEYFKERVQNTSDIPYSEEILRSLNHSGLSFSDSKGKPDTNSSSGDTNHLSFIAPTRKRMWEGVCEQTAERHKRQKLAEADK